MTVGIDEHRRLVRASRRVADGEELMLVVVPEAVHEGLVTKATRHGMTLDVYVAEALRLLAAQ